MGWFTAVASRLTRALVVDQLGAELDRASEALRSPDAATRLDAVKLLATLPTGDADELLVAALRDSDAGVRGAAAAACGKREWPEVVPALGALLSDGDAAVRMLTLRALDEFGLATAVPRDARVASMIATLAKDADATIRADALATLPRHGLRGMELAIAHLAAATEAERAALLPLFERGAIVALESKDGGHRRAAIEALHHHRCANAARAIIARLQDEEPRVREAALAAVATLAPSDGLPLLLARLDDPDRGAAARAIEALMALRASGTLSPSDVDELHERLLVLASHGEGRAQIAAIWALGEMARVSAVRPLTGLLDSKSEDVVVEACGALERLRDPRAVDELRAVAMSSWPRARAAAAKSLGAIGDVRAIEPLLDRMMRDPSQECVDAAENALAALSAPVEQREREAMASAEPATRLAAIARVRGDARATRMLLASIVDAPDAACREAALSALRELGLPAEALCEAGIRMSDQPQGRRLFALSLVAAIKSRGWESLVASLLADPSEPVDVYLRVVAILAADGGTEAKTQLARFKEHPQQVVRDAVVAKLG